MYEFWSSILLIIPTPQPLEKLLSVKQTQVLNRGTDSTDSTATPCGTLEQADVFHSCGRFREFVSLPLDQRRFCVDCQLLLLPAERSAHASHKALSDDITVARLRRPSLLLRALENKKSNAQYLFADRSCHFLLDVFSGLGYRKVLCIGTPR